MYHNFYHNIKLEHENVEIKKSPQLAYYTNQKKNVDVNKLLNKIKMNQLNETKKKNSITRFIYKEGNQILTDKLGYPKFYTQLVFEKNNPNVMIKSVINNESAIAKLSKCKKIETYQSES